ncbi:hypothetical protein BASA81_001326 [Batrachochytrium salamandrivorans]|nr:hypothetical protein BASA81_001326 [Batrachochytrium salamandrivorans]
MLPANTVDFASEAYWDQFFIAEKNKPKPSSFEWYGEFERDLLPLVLPKPKLPSSALVLGCGNSSLSSELVEHSFATRVVSVDFSSQAIEMMRHWSARRNYPAEVLEWVLADVTKLPVEYTEQFHQVWDKGSLDALLGSEELDLENARRMIRETFRCLVSGGVYYCVSLLQPHVLRVLLEQAQASFASVSVRPFVPRKDDSNKCPFLIVLTKTAANSKCEFFVRSTRVSGCDDVVEFVQNMQDSFLPKKQVRQQWQPNTLVGQFSVHTASGEPRFQFHIVDGAKQKIPFAVLILPQGREHEWTFSQLEGQLGLANAQGIGRLVLCTLCRDQSFASMKAVQDELSPHVLEFKPTFASVKNIPFMGIQEELGERHILATGETALNGPYSIEQVVVGGRKLRRLVFMNNPLAVQSEAVIKEDVDVAILPFDIHQAMAEFARSGTAPDIAKVAVCGVGGGGLVSFLAQTFAHIQSVEIDAVVVELAQRWFGFTSPVFVGDALEYLHLPSTVGVDVLMIDINSSSSEADSASGLICPPQVFLHNDFLVHLRDQVLTREGGRLVLNFACRSKDERVGLLRRIRQCFPSVVAVDMKEWNGEDLNTILCCSFEPVPLPDKSEFADAYRIVQEDGSFAPNPVSAPAPAASGASKKKRKSKSKQ